MSFDISKYAAEADVLNINTQADGFELVKLDLIDPNPLNFFPVEEDVTDLAESISVSGLMQPLVVCRTEDGRYRLIAGHRRRTALLQLREENPARWETVPCHVLPNMSEAMEELILIQTNTMSREIKWETRIEAVKRTEAALVKLSEESGVKLPGRMRTKVAETLKISEAAVARLKAIEKRLIPEIKEQHVTESLAYEISQLPPEQQSALLHVPELDKVRAYNVKFLAEKMAKWDKAIGRQCRHKSGENCHQGDELLGRFGRGRLPSICYGSCCCECNNLQYCKYPCEAGKAKAKKDEEAKAARQKDEEAKAARQKDEEAKAARQKDEESRKQQKQEEVKQLWQSFWRRFKEAREERGASIAQCEKAFCEGSAWAPYFPPEAYAEKCEAGEGSHEFNQIPNLIALADFLGVSLDWLFGREDRDGK